MSLAVDRVRDFLNARSEMSGVDPEVIAAIAVAGERHELTVFDLWELVGAATRNEVGGA